VNRERSVQFWSQSKRWVGLAAFGALAAAGLVLAVSGQDAALPTDRPSTVVADMIGSAPSASAVASAPSARSPRLTRAASAAPRRVAEPRVSDDRERLVAIAHRELEQLEVQEPTNFLAIFDMMKESGEDSEKAIEAGRRESHAYILARMRILEGMLRRFIDDPESDHTLETDALARLDAAFQKNIDALTRDVPPMRNLYEVLTTTILKAPAFIDPNPEAD